MKFIVFIACIFTLAGVLAHEGEEHVDWSCAGLGNFGFTTKVWSVKVFQKKYIIIGKKK